MAANKDDGSKKPGFSFGGILKSIDNLLNKEEYREENITNEQNPEESDESSDFVIKEENNPPPFKFTSPKTPAYNNTTFIPKPNLDITAPVISAPTIEEIQSAAQDIFAFIEKINKPGIDFFEFWNAAEDMEGGCTMQNLQQAFNILFIASGKQLTKDFLIKSAEAYKEEISELVGVDISEKKETQKSLVEARNDEKSTLEDDIQRLNNEINERRTRLSEAESALKLVNAKHDPGINSISNKIVIREKALSIVVGKIDQVLKSVNNINQK